MAEKTIILPPNSPGGGSESNYRLTMLVSKRRFLSYLLDRWWVVLVCVVLTVGAAVAYETIEPETYVSYAQLYVTGEVQLGVANPFSEEPLNYYGTQIELLKSAPIQVPAFEAAGGAAAGMSLRSIELSVVQPLKTSILRLQVTAPEPGFAQRFLQELIKSYLAFKEKTRASTSAEMALSLTKELATRELALQTNQERFVEFQKTNNLKALEEEGKSAGMYLVEKNLELAKLGVELELLNKGINPEEPSSKTAGDGKADSPVGPPGATNSAGVGDTEIKRARASLIADQAQWEILTKKRNLDPQDERVLPVADRIAYNSNLVAALEGLDLDQKKKEAHDVGLRIAAIKATIPTWETKLNEVNDLLSEGQRLDNDVQREKAYSDHLLLMRQNLDLSHNVQPERVAELQPATPAQPANRNLALWIAVALVVGLALGTGTSFCWYLLDDRFVSVRDLKDQFGETVLGLVPQIRVPRSKPQAALLEPDDARPGYVESYRHLRSALLLSAMGETRPQTLLFTGASPAEGKTTISLNLARLLARSGLRVVVVDADARSGGLTRLLGAVGQPGVLDFLRGDADAQSIIHPSGIEGMLLVPVGTHSEHAEGLFLRPRLADLMNLLRENRDFVIMDGAPILGSDDSALLVPHTDAVVLVTRPFYTRSRLVRQALDMLYQRQAKTVSFIHNRARAEDLAGHYANNGFGGPARKGKS